MNDALDEYFGALERIKKGNPRIVPKGSRITKDAVSLEAGRKKGSIKKSRPVFRNLITAIEAAAIGQTDPQAEQLIRVNKIKQTADNLRQQLDAALARELSLLAELYKVKKKLARLTGEQVVPIRIKNNQDALEKDG